MQDQFSDLLQKEVNRKEFLQISAAGFVALFGFGALTKLMLPSSVRPVNNGYGSSAYGGFTKKPVKTFNKS
jgi:hypothetical protein